MLIAGVATRALAVSAARAGYRVTAIDAFGDADLREGAEVLPVRPDGAARYTPAAAAAAARAVAADAVAYTSNFENYPDAVSALARGRRLLGNPPAVLARVRNPIILMRVLRRRGFAVPATRASAPPAAPEPERWLLKPRRSGGGHGTTPWRRGRPVSRGPTCKSGSAASTGSIVFAADGRRAVALGVSRQLVGDAASARMAFGTVAACSRPSGRRCSRARRSCWSATALADAVTEAFGLRGLNGLDFVARDGVPHPIEVNPRYSASMELVERATASSLFAIHGGACEGRLPEPARLPRARARQGDRLRPARRRVGDPVAWLVPAIADVPHAGERIGRGQPICTAARRRPDAEALSPRARRGGGGDLRAVEPRARGAA